MLTVAALVLPLACVFLAPTNAFAIGNPLVFGGTGAEEGQFQLPAGITVSDAGGTLGNVWVADSQNNRVERFGGGGNFLGQFGSSGSGNGQFDNPADVATDGSVVWVTDEMNNRVEKFAASSGAYLSQFGASGGGNGQMAVPTGIAKTSTGNLWIADTGNDRIEEFTGGSLVSKGGEFIRAVGSHGSGDGQLDGPLGIATDSADNVWVVDTDNDRVEKFSPTGEYLSQFGSHGSGNGQFEEPVAIDVAADSTIWVTDRSGRAQQFSAKGEYLSQKTGTLSEPSGIATAAVESLYVSDTGNNQVDRWSPERTPDVEASAAPERSGATFNGSVNPHGWATKYRFEYGTSVSYGTKVPVPDGEAGSGVRDVPVRQTVGGLAPGLTYHYRLTAESAFGVSHTEDKTFTVPDIRWTKSGYPLASEANVSLSGSLGFSAGTSCSNTSGTLALESGYRGKITSLSAPGSECTISGTLQSLGCTSVTSFEALGLPWTAAVPLEGPIAVPNVTLVYHYSGGEFCPSKVEASGNLTLSADKSTNIGSLTVAGTVHTTLGTESTVSGTLNLSPVATYGFAASGSRWSQEGSELDSTAAAGFEGSFGFSGGTTCTGTSLPMTLQPGSTAQATEFTASGCTISGTLKSLGCTAVTSVGGSNLPWSAYTLAGGTIYVANVTIVYHYTGSSKFCPDEVKVTGAFTLVPDQSSNINSVTVSGTMHTTMGTESIVSGTLMMSLAGKYGIE